MAGPRKPIEGSGQDWRDLAAGADALRASPLSVAR